MGVLPAHGLFLASAVLQDPQPRETAEHRAISMATTRQEMGGGWGVPASQSLQGRRVRGRQVVLVTQETQTPEMQRRLCKVRALRLQAGEARRVGGCRLWGSTCPAFLWCGRLPHQV